MEKHWQQDSDDIDEIVFRYQQGDEASGELLLMRFGCHPNQEKPTSYIGKYYTLLRYGRIDFDNRDIRRFVSLYMEDENMRKQMIPFYQYAPVKREAIRLMTDLAEQLKIMSDEDLLQDLRMLLLQQAKRYKKQGKKKTFTGYLYNSFRYELKRHLDRLLKDPLSSRKERKKGYADDRSADEDSIIQLDDTIFIKRPIIEMNEELGYGWIQGILCSPLFEDLSVAQRLILKLHYLERMTDGEIAERMGIHINTVFRQRKKAIQLLEQKMRKDRS